MMLPYVSAAQIVDPKGAKTFECAICMDLINQAVQVDGCSHVFCEDCIDQLVGEKSHFQCPTCRKRSRSTSVTRVGFIDRQIKSLIVRCENHVSTLEKTKYLKEKTLKQQKKERESVEQIAPPNEGDDDSTTSRPRRSKRLRQRHEKQAEEDEYEPPKKGRKRHRNHRNGGSSKRRKVDSSADGRCKWTGELRDLRKHQNLCEYAMISCDHCKLRHLRMDMESHLTECPEFPLQCDKCSKQKIPRSSMSIHIERVCPMALIQCDHCQEYVIRKYFQSHLKDDCPETNMHCVFEGCDHRIKRKSMSEHVEQNVSSHLNMIRDELQGLKQNSSRIESKIVSETTELKDDNKRLDTRVDSVADELNRIIVRENGNGRKMEVLVNEMEQLKQDNQTKDQLIRTLCQQLNETRNTISGLQSQISNLGQNVSGLQTAMNSRPQFQTNQYGYTYGFQ